MKTRLFSLLLILLLAACNLPQGPAPVTEPAVTPLAARKAAAAIKIEGRVLDLDGKAIAGAVVHTLNQVARTNSTGWFSLENTSGPQWVTVNAPKFLSRTRAAEPGSPVLFRLAPDDGKTFVINFAGDSMFGRRFYDPNQDGDTSDGLLPLPPTAADHARLLEPIKPLLANADLTVLNLESALSQEPFISPLGSRPADFHPTKAYVYASHPAAAQALKDAGVDVLDLGNNHVYDMLEKGITETTQTLDEVGLAHFGAGANATAAWQPALVTVKGQTVAFIGCTTIATVPDVENPDQQISYTATDKPQKGGAARCAEKALLAAIAAAKAQGSLVIVMLHSGVEYQSEPSPLEAKFTNIARDAGATLVINGHSHVLGGLEADTTGLVDQGLGNFIFDQSIWPSFESAMLEVTIREGKVLRVSAEPLMIDHFVPHAVTGRLAENIARSIVGRSHGPFVVENGALESDYTGQLEENQQTATFEGGKTGELVPIPANLTLTGFNGTGSLLLGRDLLWVGSFENEELGSAQDAPMLWQNSENTQFGLDFAYQGWAGLHLERGASNRADAVTGPAHRVPVTDDGVYSVVGMLRGSAGALPSVQVSYYEGLSGVSSSNLTQPVVIAKAGEWQAFRIDLKVPPKTDAVGLFLRLSPPASGTSGVDFDNIALVEWDKPGVDFGAQYTYAFVFGHGDLTFTRRTLPGAGDFDPPGALPKQP